ncbi:MAG: RsmD family RNA methyltransferase [Rubripirellula sp.]|nr:RsmD family RNA methyltransferase [Rubripirellula sp.]
MSPRPAKRPAKSRKKTAQTAKSPKPTKLRIIGGDMGGRTVLYHGADFTRPMKDNIRENLFNLLGMAVSGTICFDLFAGTGVLGMEAISRGASSAVLIEQHRRAASFIRKTTESLEIEAKVQLLVGDTFRLAGNLLAAPSNDTPWTVLLCPPYALWHERPDDLKRIMQHVIDNAPPGSMLVAETEKQFDTEWFPGGPWDNRIYGGTKLAITRPASLCGM